MQVIHCVSWKMEFEYITFIFIIAVFFYITHCDWYDSFKINYISNKKISIWRYCQISGKRWFYEIAFFPFLLVIIYPRVLPLFIIIAAFYFFLIRQRNVDY